MSPKPIRQAVVSKLPNLILDCQPDRTAVIWQQNRLAEARYELTPRAYVLYLRSGYTSGLKRWQYASKRRISIDELRVGNGTVE
jgi:hypothetical protein